jgi:hypothetical protein
MEKNITTITLKYLSQIVLIATATIYILGFLAINGYLSSFGFSGIELLNTRFLMAGIILIILISLLIALSWLTCRQIKDFDFKNFVKNTFHISIWFITDILTFFLVSQSLNQVLGGTKDSLTVDYNKSGIISNIVNLITQKSSNDIKFITYETLEIGFFFSILLILLGVISVIYNSLKKRKKYSFLGLLFYFIKILFISITLAGMFAINLYSTKKQTQYQINLDNISSQILSTKVIFTWFAKYFTMLITGTFLYKLITDDKKTNKKVITSFLSSPHLYIQYVIGLIVLSSLSFGRTIYPKIPIEFGGGHPREAEIIFKEGTKAEKTFNDYDYKFYLIDSTPTQYYLIAKNKENCFPIEISKNETSLVLPKTLNSPENLIKSLKK